MDNKCDKYNEKKNRGKKKTPHKIYDVVLNFK